MFQIPRIDIPELKLKSISLSVSEIKAMSDAELLSVLSGESKHEGIVPLPLQQVISSELLRRNMKRASKPHWSVAPSFWLLIIGTSAACIAAYPIVFPKTEQFAAVAEKPKETIPPVSSKPSGSQQPKDQAKR